MVHRHYLIGFLYLVLLLGLGIHAGLAQSDTAVCTALQTAAFTQTGTLCATTAPGSMCYGHPNITTTFEAPTTADFFSRPGDQAELAIIEQFTTSPADTSVNPNTWGVALLNGQANLPAEVINGPLGDKGAIYLVSGGVTVADATPPEELVEPLAQGIQVSTIAEADLRAAPVALDTDTSTNVIARVPAESLVSADAVTPDGEWVRIVFNDQPGWVSRAVIDSAANLSELEVIGAGAFTPMQSVMITPSVSPSSCQLTAGLFVQGADVVPVDIRVNGVDVRISSSVLFIPRDDGTLEIYVISGLLTIFPNDPARRVSIPPGFKTIINLADFSFLVGEGGVPFIMMTELEMDTINAFTTDIPENILHYKAPLLHLIQPSGVGQAVVLIEVEDRSDNDGLAAARQACADGDIPASICAVLGI
jgi:hypothetical protein